MEDRKTLIIALPSGNLTHLKYYGDVFKVGDDTYFDIGVGVMKVTPERLIINTDDNFVDDIDTSYKEIIYNDNGKTEVIKPKVEKVVSKGKVTHKNVWEDAFHIGCNGSSSKTIEKELVDNDGKKWKLISTETKLT